MFFAARKFGRPENLIKIAIAIFVLVLAVVIYGTPEVSAAGKAYYISPSGSDSNTGTNSSSPFKTIQKAVDLAMPGDTINLLPGTYLQDILSKRNGEASQPISIKGPSSAVVKGGGRSRVIEINHDYINLDSFTIDGLFGSSGSMSGYRDKLIYLLGKETRAGVTGANVSNMTLKNAGGECIRLRYFATKNEIAGNTITNCGVYDFKFNDGGKNGEGVYIGTAPEQLGDGKNPTTDSDQSNDNWVHGNNINTQGNECVDIKEAASGNIIENNKCTGQKDPNSAGLDSRGNKNIFRSNETYGNIGAGVRLGGDTSKDGIDNSVYNNKIYDNQYGGIKVQRTPQGDICGNQFSGNNGGNINGSYGSQFNPNATCSSGISTTTLSPTPTPSVAPSPTPPPAGNGSTELKIFIQMLIEYLQNYLNTLP